MRKGEVQGECEIEPSVIPSAAAISGRKGWAVRAQPKDAEGFSSEDDVCSAIPGKARSVCTAKARHLSLSCRICSCTIKWMFWFQLGCGARCNIVKTTVISSNLRLGKCDRLQVMENKSSEASWQQQAVAKSSTKWNLVLFRVYTCLQKYCIKQAAFCRGVNDWGHWESSGLVQIAAQNKGKRKTTKGLIYMRQKTLGRSGKNPSAP